MKKSLITGVIIGMLIIVGIIVLFNNNNENIKIGIMLPLTGQVASWGEPAKEALLMAQYEYNQNHNNKIELIFEDDKCSPEESVKGANKLVNVDNVVAIIGFACSGAAKAAIPVFDKAQKPLIIVAASNPDLTKMSQYVFRVHPSDSEQGKFAAKYVKNTLNKNNVAILFEEDAWGQGITTVFANAFEKLNGKIAGVEKYPTGTIDMKTELLKIKTLNPDLIYFIAHPESAMNVIKEARELNIDIPILAGDSFETKEIKEMQEAKGIQYTVAQINTPESFKNKLKQFSGYDRGDFITAPLAYDAFYILTTAINNADSINGKDVVEELRKTDYAGISNKHINFDEFGDISSAEFLVKTIQ